MLPSITILACTTLSPQLASPSVPACYVDLQKARDTVQHRLLCDKLESMKVGLHMLAAIRPLYSRETLSMKLASSSVGEYTLAGMAGKIQALP